MITSCYKCGDSLAKNSSETQLQLHFAPITMVRAGKIKKIKQYQRLTPPLGPSAIVLEGPFFCHYMLPSGPVAGHPHFRHRRRYHRIHANIASGCWRKMGVPRPAPPDGNTITTPGRTGLKIVIIRRQPAMATGRTGRKGGGQCCSSSHLFLAGFRVSGSGSRKLYLRFFL